MTKRATAGLGASALLLAGLLAGCSGDDDGGSGGDAFADQSYDDIKAASLEAMESLEAVHVVADLESQGQAVTLDISMSTDGDCTGSVSFGEISAEVLQADGEAWFKPSPELLQQQFGDQAAEITAFVGDSWVADTEGEVTPDNCDLEGFIDQLSDEEAETNTEVVGVEDLDGEDVVRLDYTNDDGDGSAYILAEGEHYIVKIENKGDEAGTAMFSEFDEDVSAEAPADDEIVDLADFQS
jgi:hypothetical protein